MLFNKYAPFARGASAAKALWTSPSPGFFVSTPQFQRQSRQATLYSNAEARRGTYGLDTSHCVASYSTQGYNGAAGALDDEEERKEARTIVRPGEVAPVKNSSPVTAVGVKEESLAEEEAIKAAESEIEAENVNDAKPDLLSLLHAGKHQEVIEEFLRIESHASVEQYNIALASFAQLSLETLDATPLLSSFERLLQTVTPTSETYCIVVTALSHFADRLTLRESELFALVGPPDSRLESVDEVLDSVGISDHLQIAVALARTAVETKKLPQSALDTLLVQCTRNGIDVGDLLPLASRDALPALLLSANTIEELRNLMPQDADMPAAQAYAKRAFQLGRPDLAVAKCQSIPGLKSDVAVLFAQSDYFATAWRMIRENTFDFATECTVLQTICDRDSALSTASLLYDYLIAKKQSASNDFRAARGAYLRLCARKRNHELLGKGVQESHIRGAVWGPSTILTVFDALVEVDVNLATQMFAHQTSLLAEAWSHHDFSCFVDREMMKYVLTAVKVDLQTALNLASSPFVLSSFEARTVVLEQIWNARVNGAPEYLKYLSENPHTALTLLHVHTRWILSCESHNGISLPLGVLKPLKTFYSLIASDVMENMLFVSEADAEMVTKCLGLLGLNSKPWLEYRASTVATEASSDINATIEAYAKAENGVVQAIEHARRQFMLRHYPSIGAVTAILNAAKGPLLAEFVEFLQVYIRDQPKAVQIAYLRALSVAPTEDAELIRWCHDELELLGSHLTSDGYAKLIHNSSNADSCVLLFSEAKARLTPNTALYNAMLGRLANAGRSLGELYDEVPSPNEETFRITLSGALRQHDETLATRVFDCLINSKTGYELKSAPYNAMVEYYVHVKKDRKAALRMFRLMNKHNVLLGAHSYKLLIDTWLLNPINLPKADQVLETMRRDDTLANSIHFSSLLKARGVLKKDLDSAQDFYCGLLKNSRVAPDAHIFAALVMSYVANGRSNEIPKVLDEMRKYHVKIDTVASEILALHHQYSQDPELGPEFLVPQQEQPQL